MNPFSSRITAYAIVAAVVILLFVPLFFFSPMRVGDGSEYYALYLAIKNGMRPWMTPAIFEHYNALFESQSIERLASVSQLREAFPALRVANTADFNHFWIYSLLAALIAKVLGVVGIDVRIHQAFLIQHLLLLLGVTWLALKLFGRAGVYSVLMLTLTSPLIWFTDKVHTELFSYAFALAAVMLAYKRVYLWGALCLAIASTQNPSFALLAFVLFLYRLLELPRRPFGIWEASALVGTCVTVLVHPSYYFFRYGVVTPQLLAGGAKIASNASTFYIWLLDPDVGLLPNWPFGIVLIVMGLILVFREGPPRRTGSFAGFVFLYLIINLFAQSSTTNINSGATPGLSRYALWYIPLFFPLALTCIEWVQHRGNVVRSLSAGLLFVYAAVNARTYDPQQKEDYSTPSPLSRLIQQYASGLYDPPPEVFVERYSGYGESEKSHRLAAVLGPSCDKLLIIPGRDPREVASPRGCFADEDKLHATVEDLLSSASHPAYVRIPSPRARLTLTPEGSYETRLGGTGAKLLGDGWHSMESWGVWSSSSSADLRVPCPMLEGSDSFRLGLSIVGFSVSGQPPIFAKVRDKDGLVWSGTVPTAQMEAVFPVRKRTCGSDSTTLLSVEASPLRSPKELGLSGDTRKLSLGLARVYYP